MMTKHRDEVEAFAVDYRDRLNEGESITGTPVVRLHKKDGTDVSEQFVITGITVENTRVVFTLGAAQAGTDQLAGNYDIYVRANTSDAEELVEIPEISITAKASTV